LRFSVPAGEPTPITFDPGRTKKFDLKLTRRNGVLVLELD
jgi:hypothetical protein